MSDHMRISDEELALFKGWKPGEAITIDQVSIGLLIQEVIASRSTQTASGAAREDGVGVDRTGMCEKCLAECTFVRGTYQCTKCVDTPLKDRELPAIPQKVRWISWDEYWRDVVLPARERQLREAYARIAALAEALDHALSQLSQDDDQMGDLAIRKAVENGG